MSLSRESLASAILYHLSVYSEVRLPYIGILKVESDGAHLDTTTHMLHVPRRKFTLGREDHKKRVDLLNTIHNHITSHISLHVIDDIFSEWKKEIDELGHIDIAMLGSITRKADQYYFEGTDVLSAFINPTQASVKWIPKIETPIIPVVIKTNYVHKPRRKWGLFRLVSLFLVAFCITLAALAFNSNAPKKHGNQISLPINDESGKSPMLSIQTEEINVSVDTLTDHATIKEAAEPINIVKTGLKPIEEKDDVIDNELNLESKIDATEEESFDCYLITGAFAIPENATQMSQSLSKNFDQVIVFKKGRLEMVGIPVSCNELSEVKSQLNALNLDSWTYRK